MARTHKTLRSTPGRFQLVSVQSAWCRHTATYTVRINIQNDSSYVRNRSSSRRTMCKKKKTPQNKIISVDAKKVMLRLNNKDVPDTQT